MTAMKMPDGSTCYTGPNCKKHGFYYSMQKHFQGMQKTGLSRKAFKAKEFHLPDAQPGNEKRITGTNQDPENKSPELQQLDTEAEDFKENYPKEYWNSIQHYVSSYEFVTLFLRKGQAGVDEYIDTGFSEPETTFGDVPAAKRKYRGMAEKRVADLDKVFSEYKRPEDNARKLYRSVTLNDSFTVPKVGETFVENSFMSTSLDPDYMLAFNSNKEQVIFEIISKNGVPVHRHDNYPSSISYSEREVLLNRGSKFTVTSVREATFKSSYPNGRPLSNHYKDDESIPKSAKFTVIQMVEQD